MPFTQGMKQQKNLPPTEPGRGEVAREERGGVPGLPVKAHAEVDAEEPEAHAVP